MEMHQTIQRRFLKWVLRFYSSGTEVGPKFQTLDEIKKYVLKNSLSANKSLILSDQVQDLPIPTRDAITKLLKLSGLRIKDADVEGAQKNLRKQISFISIIQKSNLDDELHAEDARLLPRQNVPLDYRSLVERANNNCKNVELAETSGTWVSTSTASMTKNGYFILREESLDNQIEEK